MKTQMATGVWHPNPIIYKSDKEVILENGQRVPIVGEIKGKIGSVLDQPQPTKIISFKCDSCGAKLNLEKHKCDYCGTSFGLVPESTTVKTALQSESETTGYDDLSTSVESMVSAWEDSNKAQAMHRAVLDSVITASTKNPDKFIDNFMKNFRKNMSRMK